MKRIARRITPPGRSAIAVIDATGFQSLSELDRFFKPKFRDSIVDVEINRIVFGTWTNHSGSQEELVVVVRSKNHVEIQCHGGKAAVDAILSSLAAIKFQTVSGDHPREDSEYESDYQSEVACAIANARTKQSADRLLGQANGALVEFIGAICKRLDRDSASVVADLKKLLDSFEVGKFLTMPVTVVFSGKPNVGKSSLTNAILGFARSIVLDQPGTTRDVVTAVTTIDGWPFEISDTAGLRTTQDQVEMSGVERAIGRIRKADVWIWVSSAHDVFKDSQTNDARFWEKMKIEEEADAFSGGLRQPDLVVFNKMDLISPEQNSQLKSRWPNAVLTSVKDSTTIEGLMHSIAESKFFEPPVPSSPLLFTDRQFDLVSRASKALDSNDISLTKKILIELIQ